MKSKLRTTAGLAESDACGGGVRPNEPARLFGWQPPTKQESLLAKVGVPWVNPWGDVKVAVHPPRRNQPVHLSPVFQRGVVARSSHLHEILV